MLILTDWYFPGYKAGGPIQSVKNLVEHLHDEVDFSIITGDSDLSESNQYEVSQFDEWIVNEKYRVCYTTPNLRNQFVQNAIEGQDFDFIYLNSLFSVQFTIRPLITCWRAGRLHKIILAPRGMLGAGALSIKPWKKRIFLLLFRIMGIHKSVTFHSTDSSETADIHGILGDGIKLKEVHNLPASIKARSAIDKHDQTKFVFASRISKKKNLHIAIEAVNRLTGDSNLDVYGASDEDDYLQKCQHLAKKADKVAFHEALPHDHLIEKLKSYEFFVLPTKNENFGHSIIEALSAGVPVIISNQTPWNDVESYGAGIVVNIESSIDDWVKALETCSSMSQIEYKQMCKRAVDFVNEKIHIDDICFQYKALFDKN